MKKSIVILAGVLLIQQISLSEVINKDVTFTEKTYGVCSTEMTVSVKDGKIESFSAVKGCRKSCCNWKIAAWYGSN